MPCKDPVQEYQSMKPGVESHISETEAYEKKVILLVVRNIFQISSHVLQPPTSAAQDFVARLPVSGAKPWLCGGSGGTEGLAVDGFLSFKVRKGNF